MVSITPFSTAGMYWRGMAPPTTSSWKAKPSPRGSGSSRRWQMPNWPWPPDCFLCLPSAWAGMRDGLAVGDAQLFALDMDIALAVQPFQRDGQVHLAADAEDGLVGLVVAGDRQGRVLVAQPLQRRHQLVVVGPGGRLDGHRAGPGRCAAAGTVTGWPLGASVSPVRVPFRRGMATKSPGHHRCGRRGGVARTGSAGRAAAPRPGCGC